MPVPGLYWADAASIGPVPARYWHIMVCLQGTRLLIGHFIINSVVTSTAADELFRILLLL